MLIVIKGAEVYSPEYLGKQDILIAGNNICDISPNIEVNGNINIETIDANNKTIIPGFIDSHAHFLGGGGEGGLHTRNPEILINEFLEAGITTAIGCLGVDGTTRHISSLLAKAKALETEGITTFIYTGTSFELPFQTVTGSIRSDMMLLDKVVGSGEIPVGDWRALYHNKDDLRHLVVDTMVGASLAGKSGIVHFHIGDDPKGFEIIKDVSEETRISLTKFIVTHVNRNDDILKAAIQFGLEGGNLDVTTGLRNEHADGAIDPELAIKKLLDAGVPTHQITISSDGNGNIMSEKKNQVFMMPVSYITKTFTKAITELNLTLEEILPVFCTNCAKMLGLKGKGLLKPGACADLLILNEQLNLETVISKGKFFKNRIADTKPF